MKMLRLMVLLTAAFRLAALTAVAGAASAPPLGPDNPDALQGAIEAAARTGQKSIVIPPGTYRVSRTLTFNNLADFTIAARGVTLLRTVPGVGAIRFARCRNVTLEGMTLVNETPPFTQGKLEKIDPAGMTLDVRIDPGYPTTYFGRNPTAYIFDRQTRQWKTRTPDFYCASAEKLEGSLFRLHPGGRLDRKTWDVQEGDLVAFRGPGATDIQVADCERMAIRDVTIEAGSGFCIHESDGEGNNYYRYAVTYGPTPAGATDAPLIAANADAFHSSGMRHGPTLEGCTFEGMCDDGVPIHGSYAMVFGVQGKDLIVAKGRFFRAGDPLRLLDPQGALLGEAKVTAAAPERNFTPPPEAAQLKDHNYTGRLDFERLTLDRPLPATFACRVSDPNANGSGFAVRGCTIRNHRARGMLIKADNGLIEGNTVEGSTIAGLIIAPEYWWNEACYSRNIVVQGNTFKHCGYATNGPGDARCGAVNVAGEGDAKGIAWGNQHIVFEGNKFEDNDGVNLLVHGAQDVLIQGNRFNHPQRRPSNHGQGKADLGSLVWLASCENVRIVANTVMGPGPENKKMVGLGKGTEKVSGVEDGIKVVEDEEEQYKNYLSHLPKEIQSINDK